MPARFESARWRMFLAVTSACFLALSAICLRAADSENVLTNAEQIRNLTVEQASRALPVKLRGIVVTEAGPFGNLAVVIADDTAGIYVLGQTNAFLDVHRGNLLEVEGVTDPGEFAPIVRVKKFQKFPRNGPSPMLKPREVTFEQLIAGSLDPPPSRQRLAPGLDAKRCVKAGDRCHDGLARLDDGRRRARPRTAPT